MEHKSVLLLFLFLMFHLCGATEYFVSLNGDDSNPGTLEKPWRHVQQAVSVLQPGDICNIREGRYSEEVSISGLQGSPGNPITFRSYLGENVVFDGTVPLKSDWERYKGNIYKTKLEQDIWQLFVDGEMQVNARWPNAFWSNFSVFDYTHWGFSAANSTYDADTGTGVMTDNGTQNLAGSGLNSTGAIAILNIGSWQTWAGLVESHMPGEDSFKFNLSLDKLPNVHFLAKNCRYFLEDKLEFLDAPTEWFYDKANQQLYLWTESGDPPKNHDVQGKVSTYAFTVTNGSAWLVFSELNFFGTTVFIMGKSKKDDVHNIKLESLHFSYPSYTKRMLGSVALPNTTTIYFHGPLSKEAGNFTVFNCTWEYADGQTLNYKGADGLFQNNLWHHNDFTCVGNGALFSSQGIRDQFIRNVVHSNGPSVGFQPGLGTLADRNLGLPTGATVRLNVFHDLKYLQNDGSHVQAQAAAQDGIVVEYNWSFQTMKRGLRFDCVDFNVTEAICGHNGTMRYNVIWNTTGMSVKGDRHSITNNLIYNTQYSDLYLRASPGSSDAYKGENEHTITTENILQNGACSARSEIKCQFPLPGNFTYNLMGKDVHLLLRDPDNYDFRPKPFSSFEDVGPYDWRSMRGGGTYWIPGRQQWRASFPIPPNGTVTAKCDADLMWLPGYQAQSHLIYFGTDERTVATADSSSAVFVGEMKMPSNIVTPSPAINLPSGTPYFWRVDAFSGGINFMKKSVGEVWMFECK